MFGGKRLPYACGLLQTQVCNEDHLRPGILYHLGEKLLLPEEEQRNRGPQRGKVLPKVMGGFEARASPVSPEGLRQWGRVGGVN